ncbi:MAG: hypothetical protein GX189_03625 [Clostridiales bacterium]|nr:hypothetical protein [Clostridiales bacterium]
MDAHDYGIDAEKLRAVWQRVMAAKSVGAEQERVRQAPPPMKTDAERLVKFIDAASAAAAIYRACASRSSGKVRRELMALSSAQTTSAQKLRARYYILTGNNYAPPPCCPYIISLPKTLAMRFEAEKSAYSDYVKAANETQDTSLSDLYFALAALSQRNADALLCLLESLL